MATFSTDTFEKNYKPNDDPTKQRTIGLELEVEITNPDCPLESSNWYDEDCDEDEALQEAFDQVSDKAPFAAVGRDGDDIELVTHPDSISFYKEGGSPRFKKCMKFLKENANKCHFPPSNSGTHINVGKLENDDTEYIMDNAYWICMHFATQLQKIAGRLTHWAKFRPYRGIDVIQTNLGDSEYFLQQIKPEHQQKAIRTDTKATMLVNKTYVYEFRMFRSTNDKNEALAWVELCHNIIQLSSGAKELEDITFRDLIEGEYISKYVQKLKGERKILPEEMNQNIKNTLVFRFKDTNVNIIL